MEDGLMKNKTWITLASLLMTLVLGCILFPSTTKAAEIPSSETIVKTYTGSVNGVERELIITWDSFFEETSQYIKIGEMDPEMLWFGNNGGDAGINRYGAVVILNSNHSVMCWSYDLVPNLNSGKFYLVQDLNSKESRYDIESLVFEGSGSEAVVVGYKTFSGEVYPLPSFDELKAIAAPGSSVPEPRYIPKIMEPDTPTPTPSTPTSVTPMPVADTSVPASDTPAPKVNAKKVSIKTEKKAKVLYEGDNFIGQYTLKKGVLTWKGPKKKGKMKGVKKAGFNEKSKKLVIWTKKGDGYVLSFKTGKMKRVVKKKVKKFIYSGKFVTKIKTTSGKTVNLRNK